MGNRLSKIATRTGDAGMTGLGDGSRVEKDHLRICAMGDVDELNSEIGVLMTEEMPVSIAEELKTLFLQIQHDLFDLGGELCIPNYKLLNPEHVAQLDVWLEKYNQQLPPLTEFILPGGTRAAAQAHVCRTVCRRAERNCVYLKQNELFVDDLVLKYLNRLSDYLFVLARYVGHQLNAPEVPWKPRIS